MRLSWFLSVFAAAGMLAPPHAYAWGPYCGPSFGAPYVSGPVYSQPIINETYVAPAHEQVIIKEIKEVVAPVAVPVVVPATVFQYLPALTPGAQVTSNVAVGGAAVQQQTAQVATAQTTAGQVAVAQAPGQVAAAAPTYQSAQVAQQQVPVQAMQQTVQTTAQVDELLRARLDAILREKQYGIAADDPPPLEDPEQQAQQRPRQPQTLQQGQMIQQAQQQPPQQAQQDLQTRAMAVVGQSCVVCHNPNDSRGNVALVNAQNQWAPTENGVQLTNADIAPIVESGRMPKISPTHRTQPLTQQQKADLVGWLRGVATKTVKPAHRDLIVTGNIR